MSKIIENFLYKDNKKYSIVFIDRITGFIKDSFDRIVSEIELGLVEKAKIGYYDGAKQGLTDSNEIALKMLKDGTITSEELIKVERGLTAHGSQILAYYKTLSLFIDIESSAKELKEDLSLEVTKNISFWKNQDLEYLKEKYLFFRSKLA